MRPLRLAAAVLVVAAAPLAAQHEGHHGTPAAARGTGVVRFPTSCNAAAQREIDRGATLMHSFWYEEAGEAFARATTADPACAMARWGTAASRLHPLWQPPSAADMQASLADLRAARTLKATPRERAWIEALAAYYEGPADTPQRDRLLAWEAATGRVREAHPDDVEATIVHALALIAAAQALPKDTALVRERRAGALLAPHLEAQPQHPGLAHYIIHAYDSPTLAPLALDAARRYATIAPAVPHALHMPSHTFTRLGLWRESASSNRDAAEAGRAYERRAKMTAAWDQRLHAVDYLVYAELQAGRDAEAERAAAEIAGTTVLSPAVSLPGEYALAAVPARLALERDRWDDAARLAVRPSPAYPATEAITHFARALGALRGGKGVEAASADLAALERIEAALVAKGDRHWSGVVAAQRTAASAWAALARGDTTAAVTLAQEAAAREDAMEKHPVTPASVAPARELLGELLLQVGRAREAREAFRAALAKEPNRRRSEAGMGKAEARLAVR